LTRAQVRENIFETFDIREEYHARYVAFFKKYQACHLFKEVIRPAFPKEGDYRHWSNWRGVAISAFRKIIMLGDESFGIQPEIPLRDADGLYLEDNVRQFVLGS
jgi:hypothetical protein